MVDKNILKEAAGSLVREAENAQVWVRAHEKQVRSEGHNADELLKKLRRRTRELKKLERAVDRRMCAGVFGASQTGKSYLLSALARDPESLSVPCVFDNEEIDFLTQINPGGGRESTGLVTRFTMHKPENIPAGYPVHVRLLSETELVKVFANSFYCDTKMDETEIDKQEISSTLDELKTRCGASCRHLTLDDMEDLHDYIDTFKSHARAYVLNEVYWEDAVTLAPKLNLEDRVRLYGLIWDNVEEFSQMLLSLLTELQNLNFAEEAFCTKEALLPRESSIIDVYSLQPELAKEQCTKAGVSYLPTVEVKTSSKICTIERQNLTAIVAELTMVMKKEPAPYFTHTDLLDFPGYKGRFTSANLAKTFKALKGDETVEQFFRRGKVAYLFERYCTERELTSLLLCAASDKTEFTEGLDKVIEKWIESTHGLHPEDRRNVPNSLYFILTKCDTTFGQQPTLPPGKKFETYYDDIIGGSFRTHFASARSEKTRWVDEWTPGRPFNNMFLLRNINYPCAALSYTKDGLEDTIAESWKEHLAKLHSAFAGSSYARKHFKSPEDAFKELLKPRDGGIGRIKTELEPMCSPALKLEQLSNTLKTLFVPDLLRLIEPYFHGGDKEEEMRKKREFFMNFGALFRSPNFKARFPELLSVMSLDEKTVCDLREVSDRRYAEWQKSLNAVNAAQPSGGTATNGTSGGSILGDIGIDLGFGSPAPSPKPQSPEDIFKIFDNDPEPKPASSAASETPAVPGLEAQEAPLYAGPDDCYAQCIIDVWNEHLDSMAESVIRQAYFSFPQREFSMFADEIELAAARRGLREVLRTKFESLSELAGVYQNDALLHKKAGYAVRVLSDFVSWLGVRGKNAAFFSKDGDITIPVFLPRTTKMKTVAAGDAVMECLDISECDKGYMGKWYQDWIVAFYSTLRDNVFDGETQSWDQKANEDLKHIIDNVKGAQARI